MASVFSKIVSGEIPCYKIAEDEKYLAFFDVKPIAEGHVLVIPKLEIDYIWDIDDAALGELMRFAKMVAVKLKENFPCKKVGVAIIGLEVAHAHIHLIPMNHVGDMDFSKDRLNIAPAQYIEWIKKMS
jgi:histidine triad (HIT) family protein